ncbi:hypothetical protein NL676_031624 [Syzygium grande]|nr:hypothetical protein NL676_031624 [Syzygium grande]
MLSSSPVHGGLNLDHGAKLEPLILKGYTRAPRSRGSSFVMTMSSNPKYGGLSFGAAGCSQLKTDTLNGDLVSDFDPLRNAIWADMYE